MRGVAMVTILSPSTKRRGKYSQCPTFDIKQNPAGRSPEDHQVRTHAYLCLNKALFEMRGIKQYYLQI